MGQARESEICRQRRLLLDIDHTDFKDLWVLVYSGAALQWRLARGCMDIVLGSR